MLRLDGSYSGHLQLHHKDDFAQTVAVIAEKRAAATSDIDAPWQTGLTDETGASVADKILSSLFIDLEFRCAAYHERPTPIKMTAMQREAAHTKLPNAAVLSEIGSMLELS